MLLHFSRRTRSVISETPPNDCMESHNLYDNQIDKISPVAKNSQQVKGHYGDKFKEMHMFINQMSNALQQAPSLSESKEHTVDIQEKRISLCSIFSGYYLIKMEGHQSFYLIFMSVAISFTKSAASR